MQTWSTEYPFSSASAADQYQQHQAFLESPYQRSLDLQSYLLVVLTKHIIIRFNFLRLINYVGTILEFIDLQTTNAIARRDVVEMEHVPFLFNSDGASRDTLIFFCGKSQDRFDRALKD